MVIIGINPLGWASIHKDGHQWASIHPWASIHKDVSPKFGQRMPITPPKIERLFRIT